MLESQVLSKKQEQQREKLRLAYREVFGSEAGKIVLRDLEKVCLFKSTTVNQAYNANQTFFNEGARNVFLRILDKIERKENGK